MKNKLLRKVIRIKATDSPNVALALQQIAAGLEPTGEILVPGVLDWSEYNKRDKTWDSIRKCVGLDGEFYEGASNFMFPPEWLNLAEEKARNTPAKRRGVAMGIDTAEGGDDTVWAIVDYEGLIHLEVMKTPDTSVIVGRTIGLMQEHGVEPELVMIDRGGGGYEHVCQLQAQGYPVNDILFGGAVMDEPTQFYRTWDERMEERDEKYTYVDRRAHMYHLIRQRIEPEKLADGSFRGNFGIPEHHHELRRQLAPIPLDYDDKGRIKLLPKKRKAENTKIASFEELIGCSPDQADALALAVFGLEPAAAGAFLKPLF